MFRTLPILRWEKLPHPQQAKAYIIQMRRKGERKYCSHRCYIAARYKDGGGND